MRWAPGESLGRWSTSVIADLRQGGVVRAPMRQVPRSPRRVSVCRSGSGSRLVRNARNCHLEDLAPASRQWARRTLHIVMLAIAFHFQVAPGQPFRCAPVAIPYEPLDGLSREALAPPGCQRLVGICVLAPCCCFANVWWHY